MGTVELKMLDAGVRTEQAVRLSSREAEILSLIARGDSGKEVAARLFVSKRTVDYHLSNAYLKLGVSNRVKAILVARRHGLIPSEPMPFESGVVTMGERVSHLRLVRP